MMRAAMDQKKHHSKLLLHMSKPDVTRVQSYGMDCFSIHTSHMSKPNVPHVKSATEWTHVIDAAEWTYVIDATEWTASVHTLHMSNLMKLVF